jgi:hypothetical protein
MINWLLEALGIFPLEPPVKDEAGYMIIVDG